MKRVGIYDAKSRLSELIDAGEPVQITKHGKPVASLTPIKSEVDDIIGRIREMRKTGGVTLSEESIVEFTQAGRR